MLSEQSTAKSEIGHVGAVATHLAMVEPRRGPESFNNQNMVVLLAHVCNNIPCKGACFHSVWDLVYVTVLIYIYQYRRHQWILTYFVCTVNCKVGDWSPWGTCSATCNDGTKTRSRGVLQQAENGGVVCPLLKEVEPCSAFPRSLPLSCKGTYFFTLQLIINQINCCFEGGKADPCQWTDWSSCDFFCNTPRVPKRTREKAKEDTKGQCSKNLGADVPISTEEDNCNVNHRCKGKQTTVHMQYAQLHIIILLYCNYDIV